MPGPRTFTVCVEVQHTAGPHDGLQGDDLIERHPEQLVVIEPTGRRMVGFMGTEVMVAKGKPFLSKNRKREERGLAG